MYKYNNPQAYNHTILENKVQRYTHMCKCANRQVNEHTCIRIHNKHTNTQNTYTSIHIYRYTDIRIYTYTNIQIYEYTTTQVHTYT